MVDTKRILANLGDRDSIGLKAEDVRELCMVYDRQDSRPHKCCGRHKKFPTEFEAKH